jgi:hypothetical protein
VIVIIIIMKGNRVEENAFDQERFPLLRKSKHHENHRSSKTVQASAIGYVKEYDEADPNKISKQRKQKELVCEQLLKDNKIKKHHSRTRLSTHQSQINGPNEASEETAGERNNNGPSEKNTKKYIGFIDADDDNNGNRHHHQSSFLAQQSSSYYTKIVGYGLLFGSLAMICTASSDSIIGQLLLQKKRDSTLTTNNRGGYASASTSNNKHKSKSANNNNNDNNNNNNNNKEISGWFINNNKKDVDDDSLLGKMKRSIAIGKIKTNDDNAISLDDDNEFDGDDFKTDLMEDSLLEDDSNERLKIDLQLSDDDLLTTCEAWRMQVKNDATMFQARLLKLSAILDATSDDSSKLPHEEVVSSIKSVRYWHKTTDLDATAKVKELTRRAKMENAGDGNKSIKRKKLEAEAIKIEEIASSSLPMLENALNEIEEKFIPASAQSETVRQRAQLGAQPTQSSWLSIIFGDDDQKKKRVPVQMAQLGASSSDDYNDNDNAQLGKGYNADPWGARSTFDDELAMEEERDSKDERRRNVASLHERRMRQQQRQEIPFEEIEQPKTTTRSSSFAQSLSNRRSSRRAGPFYNNDDVNVSPSSTITSKVGSSEADIDRRTQEILDEARGTTVSEEEEEEEFLEEQEQEEKEELREEDMNERSLEDEFNDEQYLRNERGASAAAKPSSRNRPRGFTDRISDSFRKTFGYSDPGAAFLEEASEENEEVQEESQRQQQQQRKQTISSNKITKSKRSNINNQQQMRMKSSSSVMNENIDYEDYDGELESAGGSSKAAVRRQQQQKEEEEEEEQRSRSSSSKKVSTATANTVSPSSSKQSINTKNYNEKTDDKKEPEDTFTARIKAAQKLKDVKEGNSKAKSWNTAGEAHQMQFKPGQRLVVKEDGSFGLADEDDFEAKDSDAGLQKRNEENSKVSSALFGGAKQTVTKEEAQSPPPPPPPPPPPHYPPGAPPVVQPAAAAVQPVVVDPNLTAQQMYQQNIAAMNNQIMLNNAAAANSAAAGGSNANIGVGNNFKMTSENLDAVALAKLEHDTANRNALELYDISNQNRDAAELARSEHETAMHWRQEAQKNLERLEATAAKKAISEENAAQQQEKLQNLNALVSEFKKALVEETSLRRKADIEKENLAREYEQKKIEIATKASEAQGRLIEHAKDKILEARRSAALATQQANEYLEQAKREAIARRRIGEVAKKSTSKLSEDKKALATRLQAEKDEIRKAAEEVQKSAEEAMLRLNSANTQAQKERDLALQDRQQALNEAKEAVDAAKMSLSGMTEMSKKAQKYKRRQEETVESVKEYIKNDGEGKFDKLDKLLSKADEDHASSSSKKSSSSSSSKSKKSKKKGSSKEEEKDVSVVDTRSKEEIAAEKVKLLLSGGSSSTNDADTSVADVAASTTTATAAAATTTTNSEETTREDEIDSVLAPMTDDVDSILANAAKNVDGEKEVEADDVRKAVENSAKITADEAEKNLAAYFDELTTTTTTTVPKKTEEDGDENKVAAAEDKKGESSDESAGTTTTTVSDDDDANDGGKSSSSTTVADENKSIMDDLSSDATSIITLDDREVAKIPSTGVVASLGFPSLTRIAFGEPEQKALKEVVFTFLSKQAPDSCASEDDMQAYVQERTKKLGVKSEHLRVTLVCASSMNEERTALKAQKAIKDGIDDKTLLRKLNAFGLKNGVFVDEFVSSRDSSSSTNSTK